MPSDIGRGSPAQTSRVNLYCNRCKSQLGIFENEWLRLTSSYARPKEKGIQFGIDIGSRTQIVPQGTSQKTAEGCNLSDVICQRCSAAVGQYCRDAPSHEKQYLVGHYFYKLSRVSLKESLTFQLVDPIFGFSGDCQPVLDSHAPSLARSSTWSQTSTPTIPALRKARHANAVVPSSRISRTPTATQNLESLRSPSLSTWEDIPPFGDDSLDLPPFGDGVQGITIENDNQKEPDVSQDGGEQEPAETGGDANALEGLEATAAVGEDFPTEENEPNHDSHLQLFLDQSVTTTDQPGVPDGQMALRRVAEQDLKLSNVNDTLTSLRYEMQEIRSLLSGREPGRHNGSELQASAKNAEMKALRAENEAMKRILRSLPTRLQQQNARESSQNDDSSRTPESTSLNVLGKRKRSSNVQYSGLPFNDESNNDDFHTPDLPMYDAFENVDLGDDRHEDGQSKDVYPGEPLPTSVWRGADEASIDGVDFSDDEGLQVDQRPKAGTQAASNGRERTSGRAVERQPLSEDFVAEERRYLVSDSDDDNFDPILQNKKPFKHKRTRSAERRRLERVQRKTGSLWKKGVPGGGYENGDGWVEQKRHHSGRFGRKVEVGSAPAVYPRGINKRLFKDGKQIPTTHKRLARELEYLGLSDWIEKDKSDALYRRTIRVARKHYAFHHGGISSKALCQGKYTKADLEKVGMWDEELFEEINIGEESDLEKLDFPLDPALAKAVEGWKKEAAAAKQRRRVAKVKEAAASGDETAVPFLAGLQDAPSMTPAGQFVFEGGPNDSVAALESHIPDLPSPIAPQHPSTFDLQENWFDDYLETFDEFQKTTRSVVTTEDQPETAHMISAANALSDAARKIANIWPVESKDLTTSHTLQELLAMLEISEKKERNSFLHSLREYFAIDFETGARLTIEQQIAISDERLSKYTSLFLRSKIVINGEQPAGPTFWPDIGPKTLKFSKDHGKITSMVQDVFFLQRYNKKRNLRQRENEARQKGTSKHTNDEEGAEELIDLADADDDSNVTPERTLSIGNEHDGETEAGFEDDCASDLGSVLATNDQSVQSLDEIATTATGRRDSESAPSMNYPVEETVKTKSSDAQRRPALKPLRTIKDEDTGMRTRSRTSQAREQMTTPSSKPQSTNSDKENAAPNPPPSASIQDIPDIESGSTADGVVEMPVRPATKISVVVEKRGKGRPRKSVPWNFKSAAEKDRIVKEAMEREELMDRRSSMGRLM